MARDEHDWSWWEQWKALQDEAARDVEAHGRQGWGRRMDEFDAAPRGHQPDPYTGEYAGETARERRRRERAFRREERQQARRTHADPSVNDWLDRLNPTHLAGILRAAQDLEVQDWIDAGRNTAPQHQERPFTPHPGDDRWR